MVCKIRQNDKYLGNFACYVADTIEDVKSIRLYPGSMGSEVYVIANKTTYILDSEYKWHSKAVSSESGDDIIICDCIEESTIWDTLSDPNTSNN